MAETSTSDKNLQQDIAGCESVEAFTKLVFPPLIKATQCGNKLPTAGDDYDFYASYSSFQQFMQEAGDRLLSLNGALIRHLGLNCRWPLQSDAFDIDDRTDSLIDANDAILEKVDLLIDEAQGIKRNVEPMIPANSNQNYPKIASWNAKRDKVRAMAENFKFLHAKNIQRPQLQFKTKIDNSSSPFIPKLKCKPNALVPLPKEYMEDEQTARTDKFSSKVIKLDPEAEDDNVDGQESRHPYRYEIKHLQPMDWQLKSKKPMMYLPLDETPLNVITEKDELKDLLETLKSVTEFAVDLEHHSYRSYQGFVCLMQISTRDADYIVDTLALRSELWTLNEVFSDPKIIKILHGADSDIIWLQRDFAIYVVNMFDTGQAARLLQFPRFSLSYLLLKYCNVTANKGLQLADWRIRPLPQEMVQYAREDTHYLLYIFDVLTNELMNASTSVDLLKSNFDRSKKICLRTYEKPVFNKKSYLNLLYKHKGRFNHQQNYAFAKLYSWRDSVARDNDESANFVLPNHMLLQIAENLPREPQGILACCNPIPTLVRQYIGDIHQIIKKARERSINEDLDELGDTGVHSNSESKVAFSNRENIFEQQDINEQKLSIEAVGPAVTVLTTPSLQQLDWTSNKDMNQDMKHKITSILNSFPNPFDSVYHFNSSNPVYVKSSDRSKITGSSSHQEFHQKISHDSSKSDGVECDATSIENLVETTKGQKRSPEDIISEEIKAIRQKKRKKNKNYKTLLTSQEEQFTPFDYSKSSDKLFSSEPLKTEPQEMVNNAKAYDPNRRNKASKYAKKVAPRGKIKSKMGQHTVTFKQGPSHRSNSQVFWPKR